MEDRYRFRHAAVATLYQGNQAIEVIGFDIHSLFMEGDHITNKDETCELLLGPLSPNYEYVILKREGKVKLGEKFYLDNE